MKFETYKEALDYISNNLPPERGHEVTILTTLIGHYIVEYR